jgi:hypothetical protein
VKQKSISQSVKTALAWLFEPFEGQHPRPGRHALRGGDDQVHRHHQRGRDAAGLQLGGDREGQRAHLARDRPIANGDSIGSTYRIARVRSSDKVNSILFWAPDIGTTVAADVGLYDTAANGGAVVDADFYASAVSFASGPYNAVDVTYEALAAGGSLANGEKRIWEALGLTTDPMKDYDIALTLTAASDAAATMFWQVSFTSGE